MAAFDLRLASLHLSQYIETSSSYQNTKTLLHFYDPMVIIVPPNKLAPDGMVGVSELVDKFYFSVKKVMFLVTIFIQYACGPHTQMYVFIQYSYSQLIDMIS